MCAVQGFPPGRGASAAPPREGGLGQRPAYAAVWLKSKQRRRRPRAPRAPVRPRRSSLAIAFAARPPPADARAATTWVPRWHSGRLRPRLCGGGAAPRDSTFAARHSHRKGRAGARPRVSHDHRSLHTHRRNYPCPREVWGVRAHVACHIKAILTPPSAG